MTLREYLGLLSYALTDRFLLRSAAELQTPLADVMWKLTDWNCKLPTASHS